MSRSFKKNGYSSWVRYSSDKWCKQTYARNRRRKDKAICKECEQENINDICVGDFLTPDDKFIKKSIDYSVRFSDRWSWSSDGGAYFQDDISSLRKDFEKEVFGFNDTSIWEKYQLGIKAKFNEEKAEYTLKLERKVLKRIVWYAEETYETEVKYLTTKIYPPKLKEDFGDWKVVNWWRRRNYQLRLYNWELFGFLFKNGIIPLDLKNEEEVISWLRDNEEIIIEKWLKARLLRK